MVFEEVASRWRRMAAVIYAYFFNAQTAFLLIVEIPSVWGPVLLEIFRATGFITVNQFNTAAALQLAFLLVRFFQEGQVIPALKLLVLTMVKATDELFNFIIIMVLTLAVASEMHVIVFGVYTPNYENERDAFLFIFNQFAVGAEFDANSGEMKNSEVPPSQPPPQSPQPNPVSPMPDVA